MLELLVDRVRVVLLAPFPAVHHHRSQGGTVLGRDAAQYLSEERLEVLLHMHLRQLIHLQPLRLWRARTAHHVGALLRLAHLDALRRPVAHSLIGLHPRATRLAPSRAVEDAHLDAQFPRRLQRRAKVLPPQLALELILADRLLPPRILPI